MGLRRGDAIAAIGFNDNVSRFRSILIYSLMDKKQLRRSLLSQRRTMPMREWREKSDRLVEVLRSSPAYPESGTVLAYFSFRQEPDLSPLFEDDKKRVWGLPRCVGKLLVWHQWRTGDDLETGAYGIREPRADAPIIAPERVDSILVPAVACDRSGYRLGYGAGFYDRLLSSPLWQGKITIAIVFDFAFLPHVPVDPWDIPVSAVCTETGFYRCPSID